MLHVLRWEKPPEPKYPARSRRQPNMYSEVVEQLREMPGLWGVIWEGPAGQGAAMATQISTGLHSCFRPAGSFEAVSRQSDGIRTVYARYLGDGEGE
jgi:hypothetical protein